MPVSTSMESHPRRRAPSMSVSSRSPITRGVPPPARASAASQDRRVGLADHLGPRPGGHLDRRQDGARRRARRAVGGREGGVRVGGHQRGALLHQDRGGAQLRVVDGAVPPHHDRVRNGSGSRTARCRLPRARRAAPAPRPRTRWRPRARRGRRPSSAPRSRPRRARPRPRRTRGARRRLPAVRAELFVTKATRLPSRRSAATVCGRSVDGLGAAVQHAVEIEQEGVVAVGDHRARTARCPSRRTAAARRATTAAVGTAASLLYRSGATRAPFRGLRYDPRSPVRLIAADHAAVRRYQRARPPRLPGREPYNIVHLDLAEGSEDAERPGQPIRTRRRSARIVGGIGRAGASPNTLLLRLRGVLDQARRPTCRSSAGSSCAMELEPWGGDVVPHEDTMPGPVEDRLRAAARDRTHLSPIYGTVAGPCVPLSDLLERTCVWPPADRAAGRGRRHAPDVGRSPATSRSTRGCGPKQLLIADGHHRYTTALAYRDERHAPTGPGPWDRDPHPDRGRRHPGRARAALSPGAGAGRPPARRRARPPTSTSCWRGVDERTRRGRRHSPARTASANHRLLNAPGEPPAVRALHDEVLDRAAPDDALRFTHERRGRGASGRRRRGRRRLRAAADHARPHPHGDRARRTTAAQVDLLLAEAAHRHGADARALTEPRSSSHRASGRAS